MAGIDERVVSATFENSKFEAAIAETMKSLQKLNESLKMLGAAKGLQDIEAAANKVTLSSAGTAADKLKGKMEFSGAVKGLSDIEGAADKVTLDGAGQAADGIKGKFAAMTASVASGLSSLKDKLTFPGAERGFSAISSAASRINFGPLNRAIEDIKGRFAFGSSAQKGFSEVETAANRVNFSGLNRAADASFSQIEASSFKVRLEGITQGLASATRGFTVLKGAAAVALGGIATKAAFAGASVVKSLTVEPVTGGLKEYETQLNSVQTILANTQASGATLKDVNASLNELNHYADKTIYNFGEMAKNIGTFTAAGVDLKTSTESIKGIANLAALSGSNSQQASTAMYQLSQAISSGRVGLQDWNSVVNAGMGGATFQRALSQTAVQMGVLKDSALKLSGPMKNVKIDGKSFRESIMAKPGEQSWLTSKVLTNTLKQFTGDMSDAQLKTMGFTDSQIKSIQLQAKTALDAATKVKTLSGVIDTAKEAAGSGWAQTWQLIFGDFGEAKTLFTGMSNALSGMITSNAAARNSLLTTWKSLGGRKALIEGIKNAFEALGSVIKPIKEAFREVFPPTTAKQLVDMTKNFRDFTEKLKIGPETAEGLKRTFAGLFAVLDIGKQIVKGLFTAFGEMFKTASSGSGGFLNLTGSVGDLLVALDQAIKNGDGFTNFFKGLGRVLSIPIKLLGVIATAIGHVFGASSAGNVKTLGSAFDGLNAHLTPIKAVFAGINAAWQVFLEVIGRVGQALGPLMDSISGVFSQFGDAVASAFKNADYGEVFNIIQTTLIGGIFLAIRKAIGGGLKIDFGGGVLKGLSKTFGALNSSLVALQTNVKASTLSKIAISMAALAAAVVALSLIDPKRLTSSMTAIAVGLGELIGAMTLLTKVGGATAFATMPLIAGSLVLLAGAVDTLAVAVVIFSKLSWEELAKGLAGVGGALVAVAAGTKLISPSVLLIGPGLIPLAIALNIMAGAIALIGKMDIETIGKGLGGIGGALVVIGAALQLMPVSVVLIGPGLIAVGIALNILAGAVLAFGSLKLETIGKGLLGIAGALVVIGLAVSLIPPTVGLQAAGLILVGIALNGIAAAVALMGGMDIKTIAKGILGLGAALLVLAGGLALMSGTLAGSAALLAAAVAIGLLVPSLGILGNMEWGTIIKGLAAIAGILATIGIVGLIAAPGLTAVGLSLLALGAGVTLVGGGVYLLAKGLVLIGTDGAKGVAALVAALVALIAVLPKIIIDFVKGLVQISQSIAALAPQIVAAMVTVIGLLLAAIIKSAPQMGAAFTALVQAGLLALRTNIPTLITTGYALLTALLTGMRNNIGMVTTQAIGIITSFLGALASRAGQLTAAGATALASLLKGIAANLPKVIRSAADVITRFLSGIASNVGRVAVAATTVVVRFLSGIAGQLPAVGASAGRVIGRFVEGIGAAAGQVVRSAVTTAAKFVASISTGLLKLTDAGAKAIINFMNGIAAQIRNYEPQMVAAGANIGAAIITGMVRGITANIGKVVSAIGNAVGSVISAAKAKAHIKSPSRVFAEIGDYMIQGLANGISDNPSARLASDAMATGIIDGVKDIFQIQSPSKVMRDLGRYVGDGFANGLTDSQDKIVESYSTLNQKLSDAMTSTRDLISREKDRLAQLRKDSTPDTKAINKIRKTIESNRELLERTTAAHSLLNSSLKKNKTELLGVAGDYQKITDKLKEANDALKAAQDTQDNAAASITESFSKLPDFSKKTKEIGDAFDINTDGATADTIFSYTTRLRKQVEDIKSYKATLDQLRAQGLGDEMFKKLLDQGVSGKKFAESLLSGGAPAIAGLNDLATQYSGATASLTAASTSLTTVPDMLATYQADLQTQAAAVEQYRITLDKLRAMGLDDATYQKLLDAGISGQEFANQLLAGGPAAINSINALDRQIAVSAKALGDKAAFNLYNAGVQAAQGIVNGLKSQQSAIEAQMDKLAAAMIKAIKKKLKIKSPSREFAEVGKFSSLGVAQGLSGAANAVASAASNVGDRALSALKKSMGDVSTAIVSEIDSNPTITPVLDLTQVQADAKKLDGLTNVTPITAAASYGQAASISNAQETAQAAADAATATTPTSIEFNQYNTSPKALSEVELYRQTRNQLAQVKDKLGLPA